MPGLGYPDWQRSNTSFGYPLVSDSRLATIAGVDFGKFYVGNWPNLSVGFNNHDAIALDTITLSWFDANNSIVGTGVDRIVFGSGQNANYTLPVKAPFVDVGMSANHDATQSTQTLVYGTNSDKTPLNTSAFNYNMFSDSGAFGVNTNAGPFGTNFWYSGWAQVSGFTSAGGGAEVVLSYLDPTNTAVEFMRFGLPRDISSVPQYVYLPPNNITVQLFNGTTAQNLTFNMSPAPRS
jgi:hypothetical protein